VKFPIRLRVRRPSEVTADPRRHYYYAESLETKALQVVDATGRVLPTTCMRLSAPGLLTEIVMFGHAETLGA